MKTKTRQAVDPVARFLRAEASGGFALLAAAAIALIWVNALGLDGYESLWATELRLGVGDVAITEDLRHWVNDGLMALFFFFIALEIKREVVVGDLRDPKAAALPVVAAVGGVLLPAALFLVLAGDGEAMRGWGIPMATDAAFAIAVLAVLGDRVGVGAKLFLVTIAVVDDVAAICVIAIAYTESLALDWLAVAALGLVGVVIMRRLGVARILAYVPLGLLVWVATLESGVHATIAGVLLALLVPAHPVNGRKVLELLEDRLHPVTSFVVLPLFALANAGIVLGGTALDDPAAKDVAFAVAASLVIGKLVGIAGATVATLRLRLGTLPEGVDLRSVFGIAALGGIGFTVSLFITPLAYSDPVLVDGAKLGILAGSVLSACVGIAILGPGGRHPSRHRSS